MGERALSESNFTVLTTRFMIPWSERMEEMTAATMDKQPLGRVWWLFLIQGIAALILGGLLLTQPGITTLLLVQFIGAYWFVAGVFDIIGIFVGDHELHWGWRLFSGILGIAAGILVLSQPLAATILLPTTLIIIFGIQGIILGAISIFHSFRGAGWGPGLWGVVNVIFGIILLANPLLGAATLPWVLGIFGIVGGIALIFMAFRIRSETA